MSDKKRIDGLIDNDHYVLASIGLDSGRLVQTETHLYFIIERFGTWEIVEECSLENIERVEVVENFIGTSTVIYTGSSSWTCKDLPENIDLDTWLNSKRSRTVPPVQKSPSSQEEEFLDKDDFFKSGPEVEDTPSIDPIVKESLLNSPEIQPESIPELIVGVQTQEDKDVQMVRDILEHRPELQVKIKQLYGSDVDVLSNEILHRLVIENPRVFSIIRQMGIFSDKPSSMNSDVVLLKADQIFKYIVNGGMSLQRLRHVAAIGFVIVLVIVGGIFLFIV